MDNDIETEEELREINYNPATGYQSAERLYKKALEESRKAACQGVAQDPRHLHQIEAGIKKARLLSDFR